MQTEVAFEGLEPSPDIAAAVQRWAARLENNLPVTHCEVRVQLRSLLFGLLRIARVELTVDGSLHVSRAAVYHAPHDLYPLVSDGFRDARLRLIETLAR